MVWSYGSSPEILPLTFAAPEVLQCRLNRLAGAASAGQECSLFLELQGRRSSRRVVGTVAPQLWHLSWMWDLPEMHFRMEFSEQGLNLERFQRKLSVTNKSQVKLNFQYRKFISGKLSKQKMSALTKLTLCACVHARVHMCGSCGYGIAGHWIIKPVILPLDFQFASCMHILWSNPLVSYSDKHLESIKNKERLIL